MSGKVSVGTIAPTFTLRDPMTGRDCTVPEPCGQNTLLLFFRGTWCPFCQKQMRFLEEKFERLTAARLSVVAVVCQDNGSVKKYLDKHPLPFPLLPDETRAVAKQYGTHYWVSWEGVNLANPALFILDPGGKVQFAYIGRNMSDLPVGFLLQKFLAFLENRP